MNLARSRLALSALARSAHACGTAAWARGCGPAALVGTRSAVRRHFVSAASSSETHARNEGAPADVGLQPEVFTGDRLVRYSDVMPETLRDTYFTQRFGQVDATLVYSTQARRDMAQVILSFQDPGIVSLLGQSSMGKSHFLLRLVLELRERGHCVFYLHNAIALQATDSVVSALEFALERFQEHHPDNEAIKRIKEDLKGFEAAIQLNAAIDSRSVFRRLLNRAVRAVRMQQDAKFLCIIDQDNHLFQDSSPELRGDTHRLEDFQLAITLICASITSRGPRRTQTRLPEFVDRMPHSVVRSELARVRQVTDQKVQEIWELTGGVIGEIARFIKHFRQNPEDVSEARARYLQDAAREFSTRFSTSDVPKDDRVLFLRTLIDTGRLPPDIRDRRFYVDGEPMCPAVKIAADRFVRGRIYEAELHREPTDDSEVKGRRYELYVARRMELGRNVLHTVRTHNQSPARAAFAVCERSYPTEAERDALVHQNRGICFWRTDVMNYDFVAFDPTEKVVALIQCCGASHKDSLKALTAKPAFLQSIKKRFGANFVDFVWLSWNCSPANFEVKGRILHFSEGGGRQRLLRTTQHVKQSTEKLPVPGNEFVALLPYTDVAEALEVQLAGGEDIIIEVTLHGVQKSIGFSRKSEPAVLEKAIWATFGLQVGTPLCLLDHAGSTRGIDSNLLPGSYSLYIGGSAQ